MFGKHFASMYEGSMFGAGTNVFAVWGYVIAKQGFRCELELNPVYLAAVLGSTELEIAKAIAFLCAPDPRSRSQVQEGRRLIHEGGFMYSVVNGKYYLGIRTAEDRREYFREKKREQRERAKLESQEAL